VSVAFDTLKFARALREKANMSAEQAEGVAEAFSGATSEQLSTKADLDKLGGDLRREIDKLGSDLRREMNKLGGDLRLETEKQGADLRLEIEKQGADLRLEIEKQGGDLRSEIAAVRSEVVLLKWMTGFVLALLVAVFGKLFLH
jgi:hypothetical protein